MTVSFPSVTSNLLIIVLYPDLPLSSYQENSQYVEDCIPSDRNIKKQRFRIDVDLRAIYALDSKMRKRH